MEHEGDDYTNRDWCFRYNNYRTIKRTGWIGSWRTSGDHPSYSIVENGQTIEKSTEDLRRLAVIQTPVKEHEITLMLIKESKIIIYIYIYIYIYNSMDVLSANQGFLPPYYDNHQSGRKKSKNTVKRMFTLRFVWFIVYVCACVRVCKICIGYCLCGLPQNPPSTVCNPGFYAFSYHRTDWRFKRPIHIVNFYYH